VWNKPYIWFLFNMCKVKKTYHYFQIFIDITLLP